MRTIPMNLYHFVELEPIAQEKVIKAYRDINVSYDWWLDVYEDFQQLASYFGFMLKENSIYFSSIHNQGAGSTFQSEVNIMTMFSGIKDQTWKCYAPKEELQLEHIIADPRLIKLIRSGLIYIRASTKPSSYGNIQAHFFSNIEGQYQHNHPRIEQALEAMEEQFVQVCNYLNKWLFRQLQIEYEFRTKDEQVLNSIKCYELEFLRDGSMPPAEILKLDDPQT